MVLKEEISDRKKFLKSVKKKSGGPVLLDNRIYYKGAVIKINIRIDRLRERNTKFRNRS